MRKNKGLQSINAHLEQDASFSSIVDRAHKLRQLDLKLQRTLPSQVKGICRLANLRGDTAILTCQSQLEASKIRMHSRTILQAIQQEFKTSIKKIKVKVVLESQNW